MSGRERGGRVRRERQHLPHNFTTPSPSPAPLQDSSWSACRRHSVIHSYPLITHEEFGHLSYAPPPPFPYLGAQPAILITASTTAGISVFDSPATSASVPTTERPENIGETPKATNTSRQSASTTMKAPKKKQKRTRRQTRRKLAKTTDGRTLTSGRVTCGNCKLPKNHTTTPSKKSKKKVKDADGGEGTASRPGKKREGFDRKEWRDGPVGDEEEDEDSDVESLICKCDEKEARRTMAGRNEFVEGEEPPSSHEKS